MKFAKDSITSKLIPLSKVSKFLHNDYDLICPLCSKKVSLREGESVSKYFAHASGMKEDCDYYNEGKSLGESSKHKLAKFLIYDHLKTGGVIEYRRECHRCFISRPFTISLKEIGATDLREEYRFNAGEVMGIADIALLHENNVVFVVEIKSSHSTEKRPFSWIELNATSIINAFENFTELESIYVGKDTHKLDIDQCAIGNAICYTMEDIAIKLEYLIRDSKPCILSTFLSASCSKDPFVTIFNEWFNEFSENLNRYETGPIWKIFLDRKRCLYCTKECETKYARPYCKDCYINIKNEKYNYSYKHYFEGSEKEFVLKLRKEYRWLEDIPKGQCEPCLCCGDSASLKIFYYGERQICVDCINKYGMNCRTIIK